MDGIIEVKVNGYSISKDSSIAGTQYESKSTKLRITFAENWDGYAKKITFWNALGENAVVIQLGTNLLEDILVSDSVYIVPIAGEAMTEAGEFDFVIEGIDNGVVKRTVGDKLRVLPSPKASNAGQAQDVTPTQAEQIRAEIDSVIEDIAEAKEAAVEAHEAVEEVRNMSVSCETLGVGETPTVEKSIEGDIVNLHFGIPTSEEGIHIGAEAPTEPFVKVWIDTDGEEDTEYVTREEMEAEIKPVAEKAETNFAEVNNLYSLLGDKADKSDLDEALLGQQSQIISYTDLKYAWKTDLSEYATKEDLSNVSVDMSDYYTKDETLYYANQAVSASQDFQDLLGDVRTMQETVAYKSDLSGYATSSEVDEAITAQLTLAIPPLERDIGWLMEQMDNKADKSELSAYATKEEVGDIESALDELHAYAQALIGGAE